MANRHINRGYTHNGHHNENAMDNRHVNRRHDVNRHPNDGKHFDDRVFEDNRYPNDGRHFDDRVFEDNRYPNDDRIFDDRVRENNGYHNRLHEDRSFDAGHSHERPVRQSGNRKHAHIDYEGISYGDEVYNERPVERKNPENNFHETNEDILSRRRINRK